MDSPLQIKDIVLTGKMVTAVSLVGEDFSNLVNMRYNVNGPEAIGGYTKINTTALSTYLKVRNGYHYEKDQPAESHVVVQAYNSGLTASRVFDNTTAIPSQGDFSGTALFSDSPGASVGRFSGTPLGEVAYCNGVDSAVWGGDEFFCTGFINYDPGGTFTYDFSNEVQNSSTSDVATVSQSSTGLDANVMLLLHLDNDVVDSSPTTPHTVTNNNVVFSAGTKKFGTHSADLNGTTAYLTVPDNADFDFSGGVWTVDVQVYVDSFASINSVFHQSIDVSTVAFDSGSIEPSEGDIVSGAVSGETATVHHVTVSSGTWGGGNAAGTLYLTSVSGAFNNPENIDNDTTTDSNVLSIDGATQIDSTEDHLHLYINTDGSVVLNIYESYAGASLTLSTAAGIVSINTWHHIGFVENGSAYYIFVDGILQGSANDSARPENYANVVEIGRDDTGLNFFAGFIDEYRVSKTARHTSSFDPPNVAYSATNTAVYFYVGSLRPLNGIKMYVGTANTTAGTTSVEYWNGTTWTSVVSLSDGTSSGGVTLAQTGSISFDSTSSTAKLKYLNSQLIYWYKVYIDSCDSGTTIYHVTIDAEMQSIKDIWDGTARTCSSFQKYDGSTYQDLTVSVYWEDYLTADSTTYADISSLATATDYIVCGFTEKMAALNIKLVAGSENSAAGTVATVSYWDGTAFVSVGAIDDGTIEGAISFAKSGVISWQPPASEFTAKISREYNLYYYKVSFSQTLSSDVKIDFLTGFPKQKELSGYKFPIHAQDRLWLCGDQNEDKNSAIVSAFGSSSVFNGNDSTRFYFGDGKELIAGASLYGQFSSSLYDIVVMCKENETWIVTGNGAESWTKYPASKTIGCVAPLTMQTGHASVDVVAGVSKEDRQQVVIWQSAEGIYLFDGKAFIPIHNDIDDVFDKRNTSGINRDKISDSVGFFDEYNQEYHWLWASGSSTTLDKEYVYDLKKKAWFKVERSTPFQFGMSVASTDGSRYNYATIDNGYMYRLESGNDFDGNDITSTLKLGDVYLSGSPMIESTVRIVKLTAKAKNTTANNISLTHYGDTSTSGTISTRSFSPSSGNVVAMPLKTERLGPFTTHSFKLEMTTNNETVGFEPYAISLGYRNVRIDKN